MKHLEIEPNLHKKLKEISNEKEIKLKKLVEKIISDYIKKNERKD